MARIWPYCLLTGLIACQPAALETSNMPLRGDPSLDWVTLQGGCFLMGDERTYPEEGPVSERCVSTFQISRTEVTNSQFAAFVADTGYITRAEQGWDASDPFGPGVDMPPASAVFSPDQNGSHQMLDWWTLIEGASWKAPLGPGSSSEPDHPVVHVTRSDVEAYAKWKQARLPTEAEWEYAARGGLDGTLWAWSDSEDEERERQANVWQGLFPLIDEGLDGHKGIAPVASYPSNDFGLHDMIGNVWEWTASPYSPSHTEAAQSKAGQSGYDPSQPGVPVGTIKGGSFLCSTSYCVRFRPAARQAQDLAFGTSHIGFRIVRSVDDPDQTDKSTSD